MGYDRAPAPGALAEVEALCNSARRLYGEDALADVPAARAWLTAHGHPTAAELDDGDHRDLLAAREALRDHLTDPTDAAANQVLSDYALTMLHPPTWTPDGAVTLTVRDVSPAAAPIGAALAALATAQLTGHGDRLKVCGNPRCRWVFYDRSKANAGIWCSMSICGARHKMRSYRARRREHA